MFKQSITQKPKKHPNYRLIIAGAGILTLAIISVVFVVVHTNKNIPAPTAKQTKPKVVSLFVFNPSKAPDWHAGPSDATSIVAFYNKADCFIEFDQHPGTINDADENAKAVATMQSQGDLNVTTTNLPLQLSAPGKVIPYTLHEYRSGGGQSSYYQYEEAAYIPVQQNYIAISGYCKNQADLDATVNALQAVSMVHN